MLKLKWMQNNKLKIKELSAKYSLNWRKWRRIFDRESHLFNILFIICLKLSSLCKNIIYFFLLQKNSCFELFYWLLEQHVNSTNDTLMHLCVFFFFFCEYEFIIICYCTKKKREERRNIRCELLDISPYWKQNASTLM